MKFKHFLTLIVSLFAVTVYSQTKPITPKYGVVDMDSIIMSIPETKAIYQKVDSIQNEANKAVEPIAIELQEKETQYKQLSLSGDTLALNNLNADAQLLYQELNLIRQKARRTLSVYQQDLSQIFDNVKSKIAIVGERMQLTFIIPKEEHPVYTQLGFPIIFQSPYYYSGEAVDVTGDVIKELSAQKEPVKSVATQKAKTKKSK